MPPFLFFSLSAWLTRLVLQRHLPRTRLHFLYLPLTRALTFLTMPPTSVALIVIVHLRRLQRTFWTLALGLVLSARGGGGTIAAPTGPRALGVAPSRYS